MRGALGLVGLALLALLAFLLRAQPQSADAGVRGAAYATLADPEGDYRLRLVELARCTVASVNRCGHAARGIGVAQAMHTVDVGGSPVALAQHQLLIQPIHRVAHGDQNQVGASQRL